MYFQTTPRRAAFAPPVAFSAPASRPRARCAFRPPDAAEPLRTSAPRERGRPKRGQRGKGLSFIYCHELIFSSCHEMLYY